MANVTVLSLLIEGIVEGNFGINSNNDTVLTGSAYYSSNSNDDSSSVNEDCSSSDSNGEDLEMSSTGLEIFTHTDVHPYLFEPERCLVRLQVALQVECL